jgi:hypothetical protein
MNDLAAHLKRLAAPIERAEKIDAVISRAARLAGLSCSRAFNIWYGKAKRVEPEERTAILSALTKKEIADQRNELHELKVRIAVLESRFNQKDADFCRETLDQLRVSLRPAG